LGNPALTDSAKARSCREIETVDDLDDQQKNPPEVLVIYSFRIESASKNLCELGQSYMNMLMKLLFFSNTSPEKQTKDLS
jgi:hypothetical protein